MKILRNWIPAIFVMLLIYALSSINGEAVNRSIVGNEPSEISGHFILFIILCIAFFKATKDIPLSIVMTVSYAVFDELHQLTILGRSCSIFDLGVDTLGAIISGILLWKLLPTLPKKLKNLLLK